MKTSTLKLQIGWIQILIHGGIEMILQHLIKELMQKQFGQAQTLGKI
jgi:hypothetical protein